MKTRSQEVLETGIRYNSMYVENTVNCVATVDEMNDYITYAGQIQSGPKQSTPPMKIFDVSSANPKTKKLVKIEY